MLKEWDAAQHLQGRVRTTSGFRLMGRLLKLSYLIHRRKLTASLSCFWHGTAGAKHPSIPRVVSAVFKFVPITIETDFATDDHPEPTQTKLRA